ncbi:uncharacterized protein LOC142983650 [Anticarsia gemmatalis]|uniref:uncharacterized protein LOC142983650 n=1 Tax=Anticarsia gemmatalis TaxID=129554 RepID=UPI003F7737C1
MGQDDNVNTSLAHIILCCMAGKGVSGATGKSFTHPGMHANFFIHGILGFLHYQSGTFNNDFTSAYQLSRKASKYLALPCLMADLYKGDQALCSAHLLSGVIPFALALAGQDNPHLGHLMVACNVISLCYYSHKNSNEWGWYTAAGAVMSYFITWQIPAKIFYPLTLSIMEYCAYRVFNSQADAAAAVRR